MHKPQPERVERAPEDDPRTRDWEQVLGGRVLAWVGGAAVLAGLALLFALGVSEGWISELHRVLAGLVLAGGLTGGGLWAHERRGRTEAARAAAGAGIAGLFMVTTVATSVYGLVPATVGLGLAAVVGALGAALGVRWGSPAIGWIGTLGALLAPALVGAPATLTTGVFVLIAIAAAMALVVHQRWRWLASAVLLAGTPEWLFSVQAVQSAGTAILLVGGFVVVLAAAAVAYDRRLPGDGLRAPACALLAFAGTVGGMTGWLLLDHVAGRGAGIAWLAALAAAFAALGLPAPLRRGVSAELGLLALALAVVLADLAFGALADGPWLAIGWTAAFVGFAALSRRRRGRTENALVGAGLGGHAALAVLQAIAALEPAMFPAGGTAQATTALAAVAAGCLVSARLAAEGHQAWRIALDATGVVAAAVLTALHLEGGALSVAWAAEAVALAVIAHRHRDDLAALLAPALLATAVLHTLADHAHPAGLVTGDVPLPEAALGLGACAAAALAFVRLRPLRRPEERTAFALTGGILLLHLASLVTVALSPAPDATLTDLGVVREQGQLQLSALWALTGTLGLIAGLRRVVRGVRIAALGLLGATIGKVFLYDLAALTAVYRVASLIMLGLLLLLAAFAYQRLRPEPPPDLRTVAPGLR